MYIFLVQSGPFWRLAKLEIRVRYDSIIDKVMKVSMFIRIPK